MNQLEEFVMKKKTLLLMLLSLCLALTMVLAIGCSDDDDDDDVTGPSTPINISGIWQVAADNWGNLVLTITEDASGNITGTASRSITGGETITGVVTGTNVNNTVSITVTFDAEFITLNGTVDAQNAMSGTYTDFQGDSAGWTATRDS
jgi:hypothetical protein